MVSRAALALLVLLAPGPGTYAVTTTGVQLYSVPQPLVEALNPRGLRASIPDRNGITLMKLAISINKPLTPQRTGSINVEVTHKTGNKWVYEDRTTVLRTGDRVAYWIQVEFNGETYSRSGNHTVEDVIEIYDGVLVEPSGVATPSQSTERPFSGSSHQANKQRPGQVSQATPRPDHNKTTESSNQAFQASQHPRINTTRRPDQTTQKSVSSKGHTTTRRTNSQSDRTTPSTTRRTSPQSKWATPSTTRRTSAQTERATPSTTRRTSPQLEWVTPSTTRRTSAQTERATTSTTRRTSPQLEWVTPSTTRRTSLQLEWATPSTTRRTSAHTERATPSTTRRNSAQPERATPSTTRRTSPQLEWATPSTTWLPVPQSEPQVLPLQKKPLQQVPATQKPVHPVDDRERPPNQSNQEPSFETNNIQASSTWPDKLTSSYEQTTQRHRPPTLEDPCGRSVTSVNGRLVCKGELVFLENFDDLDTGRWTHDVQISGHPDHEFNILTNNLENTYTINGQLVIRPTFTEDVYGAELLRSGRLELANCTAGPLESDLCSRQAKFGYILPPVLSGRVSTKKSFSFRYGRLEIRAKFPSGDWLYPELWLLPRENAYGPGLQSGRIQVAMARGNQELHSRDAELGARRLEAAAIAVALGPLIAPRLEPSRSRKELSRTELPGRAWSDHFHNYTLEWTPDALVFSVDGVELGALQPERTGGFLVTDSSPDGDPWQQGGRMAPFDREFYISLGLGVGGIRNFPDGVGSDGSKKPWKNTSAKAILSFWNAKDQWFNSWDSNSALLVDFVKVTAL